MDKELGTSEMWREEGDGGSGLGVIGQDEGVGRRK